MIIKLDRRGVLGKGIISIPVIILVFFIMIIYLFLSVQGSLFGGPTGAVDDKFITPKLEISENGLGKRIGIEAFRIITDSVYSGVTISAESDLEQYFAKSMAMEVGKCVYLDLKSPSGSMFDIIFFKDSINHVEVNHVEEIVGDKRLDYIHGIKDNEADEVRFSFYNSNGVAQEVHYYFYYGECVNSAGGSP